MLALSLSGKEDETSPGKGYDSSDYFITANPTQTRNAQRQFREPANPTSTRRFFAQEMRSAREAFRFPQRQISLPSRYARLAFRSNSKVGECISSC